MSEDYGSEEVVNAVQERHHQYQESHGPFWLSPLDGDVGKTALTSC
jgi:hypothetical protein